MKSRKRVTFVDCNDNDPSGDSPMPLQEVREQKPGYPKTSEYAFFKKLKADATAGHHFQSQSLDKKKNNSKKFKSSDYAHVGESSNIVRSQAINFRSLLPVQKAAHISSESFLSPVDKVSKSSEIDFKQAFKTSGPLCSIGVCTDQDGDHTKRGHADIFSKKRQKLRQLIRDTSFPQIDELCSKGHDFVSVLLSRLYPGSKEKSDFKIPGSGKVVRNAKYELDASPESEFHYSELHQPSTRRIPEVGYNDLSSCVSERSKERLPLDTTHATFHDSNTFFPHNFREHRTSTRNIPELEYRPYSDKSSFWSERSRERLPFNLKEPTSEVGVKTAISCTKNASLFNSPWRKHEHLPLSHLEDIDYYSLHGSLLERGTHTRLLGWDSENWKNATSRSPKYCQNKQLIMYPTSPTSCGYDNQERRLTLYGNDNQESEDNVFENFGARTFCRSTFLSNYQPELLPLPHPHSARYHKHDFGTRLPYKELVADVDHFPLSRTTSVIKLIEDCNYDCTSNKEGILTFPHNNQWFSNSNFHNRHDHLDAQARLSSDMYTDVGWKYLSSDIPGENYLSTYTAIKFPHKESISLQFMPNDDQSKSSVDGLSNKKRFNQFSEDMVSVYDWSSIYLQTSLDNEKASHLLLNKPARDESEEELQYEDNEIVFI